MPVPEWVKDAVFYQIFPDRFANGDPTNDPPNVRSWGAPPSSWEFQGGDFRGIIQHFDYLLDLGVNAIYLNPIFQATTNHRYNTTNYYCIDPKLGSLDDFKAFLELTHQNHMHVILDGVFNHCGRGFFAFNDVLENQAYSPYLDWFHIKHFPVDAYLPGDARDYLGWWELKQLPKFNTDNPEVRKYLFNVARYWIEVGIDGWRLDVPNEIDDDSFWAEFRAVVKCANPEAYILGEIWTADKRWVGESHFDGLINYPFRDAVLRLLEMGTLDMQRFVTKLEELIALYPLENLYAMYVPLGSHDTERLLTKLNGHIDKAKLAFLIQFAIPGAPAVYYGDEIGMLGGKDPECRATFPWDEKKWNLELRNWVKKIIAVRKSNPALRRGEYRFLCANQNDGCLGFLRHFADERVVVLINASAKAWIYEIPISNYIMPKKDVFISLINGVQYPVSQGKIKVVLEPWSGDWIQ